MYLTAVLFAGALVLFIFWWLWNRRSNTYFAKLNVPYLPAPMLGGQLRDMILQRKAITDVLMDIYNDPGTKSEPLVGVRFLHIHGLVVKDLQLIKQILVKDFNAFQNRRTNSDIHSDSLGGNNMFMLKNPAWREVRTKITPVFTGNKMRQLFKLVLEVAADLNTYLDRNIPVNDVVDVKNIAALYTTDVIATCAYGVQANSLSDPKSEFRRHGKKVFDFTTKRSIEFGLFFMWPEIVPFLKLKLFSKESTKFLTKTLVDIMNEREKNQIVRNDLIDVLIGLRKKHRGGVDKEESKENVTFKDEVLVAQAAVFFTAGFETTSSAIAFTLYELAKQPTVQRRLREEIKEFLQRNKGQVTYENIGELTYLNQCCRETFRMYPPLPYLDRECAPENGEDHYSLEPISNFNVPRGFPVYIPTFALHRNEQYFPNPLIYDPDRFSVENQDWIPPYAYVPFGMGPRNCIGERFGVVQVKLGIINFLQQHWVEVCEETIIPMTFSKMAMILTPAVPIKLRVRKDVIVG